jgi:hypothetical protein
MLYIIAFTNLRISSKFYVVKVNVCSPDVTGRKRYTPCESASSQEMNVIVPVVMSTVLTGAASIYR